MLVQREQLAWAHEGTGAYCAFYKPDKSVGTSRIAATADDLFRPVVQDIEELTDVQWGLVGRK